MADEPGLRTTEESCPFTSSKLKAKSLHFNFKINPSCFILKEQAVICSIDDFADVQQNIKLLYFRHTKNEGTLFCSIHNFESISNNEDFKAKVPLSDYEDFKYYIYIKAKF